MNNLAQVIESELSEAIEKNNKESLHRGITLILDNIAEKHDMNRQFADVKSDIKILTETMEKRFAAVDKRFEDMNKRFEAVDKRFEAVDKRFEAVDKRFEDMYKYMDKRFEAVDKRFEDMNTRFEDMNKRFEDVNKTLKVFMWAVGLWMALFTALSVVLKVTA